MHQFFFFLKSLNLNSFEYIDAYRFVFLQPFLDNIHQNDHEMATKV